MIVGETFAFVRNPKTASRSITMSLCRHGTGVCSWHCPLDIDRDIRAVVVRNPWDRLVSAARHLGQHKRFSDWLRGSKQLFWLDILRTPQTVWTRGCTHILRFESLKDDWQVFCADAGFPGLPLHYNDLHRNAPVDYREFYTDEDAELVAERFAPDIKEFGYAYT